MKSYSEYLAQFYGAVKVQKISINAGFSCPNRDGRKGSGGCTYCRIDSFTPAYCTVSRDQARPVSHFSDAGLSRGVSHQIKTGQQFFGRKYKDMKYLAYFQSYTNTYDNPERLGELYREALDCPGVVGLVVGTRPDTLPDPVLDLLARLNAEKPVFLEIGAESSHDGTLESINRHHTWHDVVDAVTRATQRGLHCGLHLIAGLPGEDDAMVLETVRRACGLPIETLKLHQLQILKDTTLYRQWIENPDWVKPYELEDYLYLCRQIIEIVPEHIVIERYLSQSPPELVAAPKWGLKNYQFMNLINNKIRQS